MRATDRFLRLSPTIAAVTNLDREHLDHYGSMERINECFLEFINKVPFYGLAVLCADDDRLQGAVSEHRETLSDLRAVREREGVDAGLLCDRDQLATNGAPSFGRFSVDAIWARSALAVPGRHNVSNALVAIAIGIELDVPVDLIRKALAAYTGVERRFHLRGEANGIMVVDDYGHHPTEIKATLAAAKQGWGDRRLVVLFQPHRYTRTRDLLEDFSKAFDQSDVSVLDGHLCGQANSRFPGYPEPSWPTSFVRPAIRL